MKKWVIKPQLEKSPKWRLFGRQEKEEIQQQVLSGIIPQGSAAISDTAEEYTRALEKLLGKIQALEIAAERADQTLVDGRLQVGHTHPFSPEGFLGQRLSRPKAFSPKGFLARRLSRRRLSPPMLSRPKASLILIISFSPALAICRRGGPSLLRVLSGRATSGSLQKLCKYGSGQACLWRHETAAGRGEKDYGLS